MNIMYCGDINIEKGVLLSVLSLMKNVKEELNIYILTINLKNDKYEIKGVTDSFINKLNNEIKSRNSNNNVTKFDITNLFEKELPIKNMNTRFTPCCMLRLFADEIPTIPSKILYLDNDVLCRKDCTNFYNQNIDNYEFAGVLDYYGKWFFKNRLLKFDYINSGVMLLNMNLIKETKLFKQCRKMCCEKQKFMPDQSAINKIAIKKKIAPRIYNEQRKLHDDTVFQHFTTSFRAFPILHTVTVKPWHIEEVHNKLKIKEYDDIFTEYQTIKQNIIMEEK